MKAIRLLGILTLTIFAFTGAAKAQSVKGKFTLPYEVHWGAAVLPAGDYTVSMDSFHAMTLVRPISNTRSFYTGLPVTANSDEGAAYLLITSEKGEHRVRSMNLPQMGKALIYEPLTKAEREQLAKAGKIETVPVFAARK
jgi:hypothetical protein